MDSCLRLVRELTHVVGGLEDETVNASMGSVGWAHLRRATSALWAPVGAPVALGVSPYLVGAHFPLEVATGLLAGTPLAAMPTISPRALR
jgi:membrane-associated phospholipid phosphatase